VGGTANLCQVTTSVRLGTTTTTSYVFHDYGWRYARIDLGKFGSSYWRFREYIEVDYQSHGARLYNATDGVALAEHVSTAELFGAYNINVACTPPSGVKTYHVQHKSDGTNTHYLYSAILQSASPLKNLFLTELVEIEEEVVEDGEVKRVRTKVPRPRKHLLFSYGVHAYSLEEGFAVIQVADEDVERVREKTRKLGIVFEEITEERLRGLQRKWKY